MAETFSIGDRVSALWGHTWYAGVVDDILDGGRAYEIAWADEETVNEVPAADVRALAPSVNEPRPKKQKVPKPRADKKTPPQKRLGASPFVEKPLPPAADESEFAYRARARRPHRRLRDDVDANDDHCSVCCDGGKLLCCATCPRSVSRVETRRECQNDVNAGRSMRPACATVWGRPTCRARGGPSSTSAVAPRRRSGTTRRPPRPSLVE